MKGLRKGFTTGSCAAAAAKAATYMLLSGHEKNRIQIITPSKAVFEAEIVDIVRQDGSVSCAVIKDGGDDPDVTTGCHVVAKVTALAEDEYEGKKAVPPEDGGRKVTVSVDGGVGVGRVTLPGLDQPVNSAAINRVPREMIKKEVLEVCKLLDFCGSLSVVISVPEGEALAKRTFNPRLGIVGGISILGTSGVVEPMSEEALLESIRIELAQKKALGQEWIAIAPGNYGLAFMKESYGYDLDQSVKCSNFIGKTVDMVVDLGFKGMVLTGDIGKLIKVSGGIMNTHSHEADARMELLCGCALRAGADAALCRKILESVVTREALQSIAQAGLLHETMEVAMERILFYLNHRADDRIRIECVLYAHGFGLLAESEGAREALTM